MLFISSHFWLKMACQRTKVRKTTYICLNIQWTISLVFTHFCSSNIFGQNKSPQLHIWSKVPPSISQLNKSIQQSFYSDVTSENILLDLLLSLIGNLVIVFPPYKPLQFFILKELTLVVVVWSKINLANSCSEYIHIYQVVEKSRSLLRGADVVHSSNF